MSILSGKWVYLRQVVLQRAPGNPYLKTLNELGGNAKDGYERLRQVLLEMTDLKGLSSSPPLVYLGPIARLFLFDEEAPCLISVPFGAANDYDTNGKELSRQTIPHEVAHAIFSQIPGLVNELRLRIGAGLAEGSLTVNQRSINPVLLNWLDEVIADMAGTALGGYDFALSASAIGIMPDKAIGITDGGHPIPLIRPYIHAEVIHLPEDEIKKLLEIPPDFRIGDYAFPCYSLSKTQKRSPNAIAGELAQSLPVGKPIEAVRAVGPYINFFLDKTTRAETVLKTIFEERDGYGHRDVGKGKTVVVDYSSPNIAKHLVVHHLRSALIGNAIYQMYTVLGYRCVGINHLGDWGTQFGPLIVAYTKWGNENTHKSYTVTDLNNLYVKFHQEAETNPGLEDEARSWFKKLESGDPGANELWQHFKDISLKEFQKIYDMLGIHFDAFVGDSFYNTMVEETITRIKEKGLSKVSEQALIVDLEPYQMPTIKILLINTLHFTTQVAGVPNA